jgi:cytidine deaminase
MHKILFKKLSLTDQDNLLLAARTREHAYAPYSKFKVGCTAVSCSGKPYIGCNVESADYTLTTHAEMSAINAMIAAGERLLKTVYIVLSSPSGLPVPCGLCRQKMFEFAGKEPVSIYCANIRNKRISEVLVFQLDELLPYPFGKETL